MRRILVTVVPAIHNRGNPYSLFFVSTDKLELIDESKTPLHVIKPKGIIKTFWELPELEYNRQLIKEAREILLKEKPAFIYQRYSLNNYAGVYLSGELNIPLILEYNGSIVQVSRNWERKGLRFSKIAAEIEALNLYAADLIIVVSDALKKEIKEKRY